MAVVTDAAAKDREFEGVIRRRLKAATVESREINFPEPLARPPGNFWPIRADLTAEDSTHF